MTEHELVSIIGPDAAQKMVAAFGGSDLNVPKNTETPLAQSIADVIGTKPTSALIKWARGCRVYVERNASRERAIRVSEIRQLINSGMSVAAVARTYTYETRLSERAIYTLLKEA